MKTNNKNKHSARKKLFPAIAMLTTSAIMLSTATYAWFTMNKEVKMTGLNMTATTGDGMEISLGAIDASNAITFSGDTFEGTHPKDTEQEKGWKSTVVVGNYYKNIGKLKPASSVDGIKLYDATNATDGGKKASEFSEITLDGSSMAALTQETTYTENSSDTVGNEGQEGYYVDIPVHLRTSKVKNGEDTQGDIYSKILINNNKTNAPTEVLYKAVRIAFLPSSDANTNTKVYTCDELTNYYENEDGIGKAVTSATGKSKVTGLTKDNVTDGTTFSNGTGTDTGLKIPYATQAGQYGHLDFVVRVWLEGESTSCFNDNAGQDWNISFAFSMGEFPTTP